jgi:hypothetical protein
MQDDVAADAPRHRSGPDAHAKGVSGQFRPPHRANDTKHPSTIVEISRFSTHFVSRSDIYFDRLNRKCMNTDAQSGKHSAPGQNQIFEQGEIIEYHVIRRAGSSFYVWIYARAGSLTGTLLRGMVSISRTLGWTFSVVVVVHGTGAKAVTESAGPQR